MSQAMHILYVDLSNRSVRKESLDKEMARDFIGGWGINAVLSYQYLRAGTDAFSPDNPIIIGAGLLGGTPSPGGGAKVFLTTKCPSTGVVGTAVSGGWLSSMLKWAGHDQVVVTGKAEGPVYLAIQDDEVSIHDARHLWGLDLYQTTDELRKAHGPGSVIACIGPAGERLSRIALLIENKTGTLGRTAGGVMGSKNLKAIVVQGSRGVRAAHPQKFMKMVNTLVDSAMKDPLRDKWTSLGLYYILPVWAKAGHLVYRNWRETFPQEKAVDRFGPQEYEKRKLATIACASCLAGDKSIVEVRGPDGSSSPSWAACPLVSAIAYGVKGNLEDLDQAYRCHDLATRYGIDGVTATNLIDWSVDLYQRGIITKEDSGIELIPGFDTIYRLLEQIGRGEGFGAVLGEGWLRAMAAIGRGSEAHALHIKGSDPDFDPRVSFGVETMGSVTNPRGAHDMPAGGITIAVGRDPGFFAKMARRMGFPDEKIDELARPSPEFNLGGYLAHYENWCTILNCFGICFRMQVSRLYDIDTCVELYQALTGTSSSPAELMKAAERAYTVYKAVNVREGFSRKDDQFPHQWLNQPLRRPDSEDLPLMDYFKTGTMSQQDVQRILDNYYREKGWEVERGIPTPEKLAELGLSRIAADFRKAARS